MRKEYHFRQSPNGLCAWDVDTLIELAADLPDEQVALSAITEVGCDDWFGHGCTPTVRTGVEHFRPVNEVDLTDAVILDPMGAWWTACTESPERSSTEDR